MRTEAERRIERPRAVVWAALNDVKVLRASLPGCRRLERVADEDYAVEAVAEVGSVQATFHGTLKVSEADPPRSCRLSGSGSAGPAGYASGSAIVRLLEDGEATRLTYAVDVRVGGKLAQIDSQVMDAAARDMADAFFERFVALVAQASAPGAEAIADSARAPAVSPIGRAARRGVRPLIWVPSLILLVFAILIGLNRP